MKWQYRPEIISIQRNGQVVAYGETNFYRGVNSKVKSHKNNYPAKARRRVTNAVVYMAYNSIHRCLPAIFTTLPGTSMREGNNAISTILNRLRNLSDPKKIKGYVWVAEYTKKLAPHYHILMDLPFYDIQKLSLTWSDLVNIKNAKNSVRLHGEGNRLIKSPELAFYFAKYISKQFEDRQKGLVPKDFNSRYCGISNNVNKVSHRLTFEYPFPGIIKDLKFKQFNQWVSTSKIKNLDEVNRLFIENTQKPDKNFTQNL